MCNPWKKAHIHHTHAHNDSACRGVQDGAAAGLLQQRLIRWWAGPGLRGPVLISAIMFPVTENIWEQRAHRPPFPLPLISSMPIEPRASVGEICRIFSNNTERRCCPARWASTVCVVSPYCLSVLIRREGYWCNMRTGVVVVGVKRGDGSL